MRHSILHYIYYAHPKIEWLPNFKDLLSIMINYIFVYIIIQFAQLSKLLNIIFVEFFELHYFRDLLLLIFRFKLTLLLKLYY